MENLETVEVGKQKASRDLTHRHLETDKQGTCTDLTNMSLEIEGDEEGRRTHKVVREEGSHASRYRDLIS